MTPETIQQRPGRTGGNSTAGRIANGLGWFSIGLGLAEVFTPDAVADLIGAKNKTKTRTMLRLYGLREIAAGVGILSQTRPATWMWARVAGDALDLSSLLAATRDGGNGNIRATVAMASVVGITAADVYCAQQLSNGQSDGQAEWNGKRAKVVRTIIIDKPAEEAYRFWRNFENLPQFMTYLQSVRYTGARRTHWIAKGPVGAQIEWDADLVTDEPNRTIGWKSVDGSAFDNTGSVRFEAAPGGRGTLLRVEMDYSKNRGAAALGKLLRMDLGRRIMHDLRNFKQVMEVGEVTQSDASIHPGMHAARPEPVHAS